MKILFVHSNIEAAGAEAAESREMIKALLDLDVSVGVLYVGGGNPIPGIESAQRLCVDYSKRFNRKFIQALLTKFRPEVAHIKSLWIPFQAIAASALRRMNVPYIVEPGGGLSPYHLSHRSGARKMRLHNRAAKLLYQKFVDFPLCQNAGGIHALSAWEARLFRDHYKLKNEIRDFPLGFNKDWVTGERLKAGFAENAHPLRVNYLGRLDIAQKGLDLFLDALSLIQAQGNAHLFNVRLAGPDVGSSSKKLPRMIEDRGLKNVSVEGGCFGEAKVEFFRNTDIFFHLSRSEEMAKLPREAIGAGVPVLASLESNFGDWVKTEGSGLAADLNPGSIADQLLKCSKEPLLVREMAARAIDHANKYPWNVVAAQLIQFYSDVFSMFGK